MDRLFFVKMTGIAVCLCISSCCGTDSQPDAAAENSAGAEPVYFIDSEGQSIEAHGLTWSLNMETPDGHPASAPPPLVIEGREGKKVVVKYDMGWDGGGKLWAVDVSGDGIAELIYLGPMQGSGGFPSAPALITDTQAYRLGRNWSPGEIDLADLDKDGTYELLTGSSCLLDYGDSKWTYYYPRLALSLRDGGFVNVTGAHLSILEADYNKALSELSGLKSDNCLGTQEQINAINRNSGAMAYYHITAGDVATAQQKWQTLNPCTPVSEVDKIASSLEKEIGSLSEKNRIDSM